MVGLVGKVVLLQDNGIPWGLGGTVGMSLGEMRVVTVLDINNSITAPGSGAAEVGAAHHTGNTFEGSLAVAMDVAAERGLGVVLLKQIEHDEPIVDLVVDRVVGDEDDGLITVRHALERLFQPAHVFGRPMAIAHFHERTLVHGDEAKAAEFEY